MNKLTRGGGFLYLFLSERTGWECKGHGSLGLNHHEMVQPKILRELSKTNSRITNMELRRAEA